MLSLNIQSGKILNKLNFAPYFILLAILITRLMVQFVLYRQGFTSIIADDFGRVVWAASWAENPTWTWSGFWLPFYQYFYGAALKVFWDLITIPRILTILLGLISIVSMYRLGVVLFNNTIIGWVSAFLMSVNPLHLWLGSTPLAEMSFIAFGTTALVELIIFLKKGQLRSLYLASLCLLLANGFRFEAWMTTFAMSVLLVGYVFWNLRLKKIALHRAEWILAAAVLPWTMPLLFIIGNTIDYHDPFYFLNFVVNYKGSAYGADFNLLNYFPPLWQMDPFLLVLGWPALIAVLVKKKRVEWIVAYIWMIVFPLVIFIFLHKGRPDPISSYQRYLAPFVFLFYPLLAWAGLSLLEYLSDRARLRYGLLALFLLGVTIIQLNTTFQFKNDISTSGVAVGKWIQSYQKSHPELVNEHTLIEMYGWEYLAVMVGAGNVSQVLFDRPYEFFPRPSSSLATATTEISDCLVAQRIRMVVLRSPDLQVVFEQSTGLNSITEIHNFRIYVIPQPNVAIAMKCELSFGYFK